MIAAVIREELGLIGCSTITLAFAGFAVLGYRIAMACDDPFGKYLAAGDPPPWLPGRRLSIREG